MRAATIGPLLNTYGTVFPVQLCSASFVRLKSSQSSLKSSNNRLSAYDRRTGRGFANEFRQRDVPRIRLANSKIFTRLMGRIGGINTSLEDTKLLLDAGKRPKGRHLSEQKRRKLGTVFMQNLFQIIAESDRFDNLQDLVLLKVEVDSNYMQIKVHWAMNGNETDEVIAKSLEESQDFVRRRLAETLGNATIPRIVFVGERSHLLVEEMNRLFEIADYGMQYRAVSETGAIFGSMADAGSPIGTNDERKNDDSSS